MDAPAHVVNARLFNYNTALMHAVILQQEDKVRVMVAAEVVDVNATGGAGFCALHSAARDESVSITRLLLSHPRIDASVKDNYNETPLHWAAYNNRIESDESLLAKPELDIDAVDPHFAPGTGTCARGGLGYREIHYICEEMALSERLVGMDLVEVNPGLDPPPPQRKMHGDDAALAPASPTVQLAMELALSALGKTIL